MSKKNLNKNSASASKKQELTNEQVVAKKMLDEKFIEAAKETLKEHKDEQVHFVRLAAYIERRVQNTTKEGDEVAQVPAYILKNAIYKVARAMEDFEKAKTKKAKEAKADKVGYLLIWAVLTREAIKVAVNYDPVTDNREVAKGKHGLQEVKDGASNISDEDRKQIAWSGNKGKGEKINRA